MPTNDQLLRAVQLATHKLASSGKFDSLMKDVLVICVEAVGASGGTIYLHDPSSGRLRFQHVLPEFMREKLPMLDIPDGFGMAGRAFMERQTICQEYPPKSEDQWNPFEKATGVVVKSMVATPLMMESETPIGVVQLLNKHDGAFNEDDCAVLDTVASVATMAYNNYRLTEESARASTLLGMGKVSHDIGNLAASLYASLSFTEMAVGQIRDHVNSGDDLTSQGMVEDVYPMFDELRGSVDRIVGYSRMISDLSAGRVLRPEKAMTDLREVVPGSASYLESEARKNHVRIVYDICTEAPLTKVDELYVFRIVQNLVGNAIKAVYESLPPNWDKVCPDGEPLPFGDVVVRYRCDGENHAIEVLDTGPGMPEEIARRILSGNAKSMWDKGSGSGWGTKIVLELTAAHNGKVEIESEIGKGSMFRVVLPHCVD